jgi:hypothetical protein
VGLGRVVRRSLGLAGLRLGRRLIAQRIQGGELFLKGTAVLLVLCHRFPLDAMRRTLVKKQASEA